MAYGVKYRFDFDSEQGSGFRINVLKDGYGHASPVLTRHLGGSPVIRREKSDCICGTSLEFPAECAVDGEFEEFKTSVPFTFKVNVYGGTNYGTLIWTGYVTPELMEAPDIAPPYDVQVCCTDGLGELKYTDFPARGGNTLYNHLEYLLSLTGSSLSIVLVNDITHGSYDAARFLHETGVNLDFMAGQTCYDVLQAILTSIHATITQADGKWLIFRETGAAVNTSTPAITNAYVDGSTTASPIAIQEYGSASDHSRWPVGHMTHGNVPPRKGMVLTTDNHYAPNLLTDAVWQAVSGGTNEGDYWSLPAAGDGMKNSGVSFDQPISQKLILSIKVRNVGSGSDDGKMSLKVKAVGNSYAGNATYYLSNYSRALRAPGTTFGWDTVEKTCEIGVQAPAETDTDDDYVEIGIVIPIYRGSPRNYFYCSSLEITIANQDGAYEQRVYGVTLSKYEQFAGFRKEILLNNGARGKGNDLSLIFSPIVGANDYTGAQEIQLGLLYDATLYDKISTLKSSTFTTAMDYLSLMARDYALSVAGARTYVRGVLNVPVGTAVIPVAFQDDGDGAVYFIDTLSWDLDQDEMSVEMTSAPATAITVSDEVDESAATQNATDHQQAQSSGGGGGGGGGTGTVTSVALSLPTYFDISGSPVTGSGTLTATLKTTYKIPTVTEWNSVDGAKHTHSNKTLLDGISSQDISEWDSAAAAAHTHSNKSTLDGISSNDVAGWDDAATNSHTHSNKSQLDSITAQNINDWNDAATKKHTHSNKYYLDQITDEDLTHWTTAYWQAHQHSNKSILDGITQADINAWDAAGSMTVDVSIGGTNAAPTVAVELGNGNSDSAALPVASASKSGIVDTGAQTFSGYKTFDRIYLGSSGSFNAYIEWDSNAGGFKIVGDVYATGGVSAGA